MTRGGKRIVWASVTILALLVCSSLASERLEAATVSTSTQVIPGITETQPWLDQQLVAWMPTSIHKMQFGAPVLSLSYGNIYSNTSTPQVVEENMKMVEQTGGSLVRFDLGYDAWLANDSQTIQQVGDYVQMVNDSGKLLVIADSAAERYRSFPQTWTNFQIQWLQRVKTLASLYHPYAYIVVKEPGWYYPMISDAKYNAAVYNANSWGNLTEALADTVKSVSPDTKVGVAVAAFDLYNDSAYQGRVSLSAQYLANVEKIPNVDFVGFDIYDIAGFLGTQRFLSQYGTGGKQVWITEAWSGDQINLTDPSRAPLDSLWIQVLYNFALHVNATAVLPFYSNLFASYETPPTNVTGMLQFYQQRTPVFYEFQKVIAANAAGVQLNYTSSSSSSSSYSSSQSSQSSQHSQSSGLSNGSTTTSATSVSASSTSSASPPGSPTRSGSFVVLVALLLAVGTIIFVVGLRHSRRRPH